MGWMGGIQSRRKRARWGECELRTWWGIEASSYATLKYYLWSKVIHVIPGLSIAVLISPSRQMEYLSAMQGMPRRGQVHWLQVWSFIKFPSLGKDEFVEEEHHKGPRDQCSLHEVPSKLAGRVRCEY